MLTAIPTSACATSSQDDTKWQGAAPAGSLTTLSMGNSVCCASNACHSLPRRVPCGADKANRVRRDRPVRLGRRVRHFLGQRPHRRTDRHPHDAGFIHLADAAVGPSGFLDNGLRSDRRLEAHQNHAPQLRNQVVCEKSDPGLPPISEPDAGGPLTSQLVKWPYGWYRRILLVSGRSG